MILRWPDVEPLDVPTPLWIAATPALLIVAVILLTVLGSLVLQ